MELKRANGETLIISGYHHVPVADGTPRFADTDVALPGKVDLRPLLSPVERQGVTQSCSAHATAGAYEYLMKRHPNVAEYDVSRLFIYYNARALAGATTADGGASLTHAIGALKKYGACAEASWPFHEASVNEPPSERAYGDAKHFAIGGAELVPTKLRLWKAALAAGHPIIFALRLFKSFDRHARPGLIPMPTAADLAGEKVQHAMLCVGYSDEDRLFIVRNSWGADWGDGGYCYVPYVYMMSYNVGDSWIIKHVDLLEPDTATHSNDTSSILGGADTMLARMSDEAYGRMLDAMGEHPFELRLALIFLRCAAGDGCLDEAETTRAIEDLERLLGQTGGLDDAHGIFRHALTCLDDDALFEDSLQAFKAGFTADELRSIAAVVPSWAEADGVFAEQERKVYRTILAAWGLADDAELDSR